MTQEKPDKHPILVARDGVRADPSDPRLIAAAPDLLAACEAAEEWLSGWASAEPYISIIRDAIAKAKGT